MTERKMNVIKPIYGKNRNKSSSSRLHRPGVDREAAWLKKAGKLHYGYKKHLCTDDAEGMITAVVTTAANESDMHHITDVVDKAGLKKGAKVKADKGYASVT